MPTVKSKREGCIGCETCTNVCPDFWKMGDDGKSVLRGAEKKNGVYELEISEEAVDCNRVAADSCPVSVIHLEE